MEQYKQEFIEFMIDCQVLKFGDFVTKSGRKTPFFVNTGFYRTGAQLRKLGGYYARAIHDHFGLDFDVLFGPAYKGIPLTVAATMAISEQYGKDIRYCSNRKEVKDHGDKGILLGSPMGQRLGSCRHLVCPVVHLACHLGNIPHDGGKVGAEAF